MSRKVVRFELEYEDGEIVRLTGDDAHGHLENINGQLGFLQARNPGCLSHWPERRWETVQPSRAERGGSDG